MVEIVSRKSRAESVAGRWQKQMRKPDGRWTQTISGDSEVMYERIVSLGRSPDPDSVDRTIGNNSWTVIICEECGEKVEKAVQFVDEDDREVCVCASCITNAFELINA